MKKVFLSLIAAATILAACNQNKAASTSDTTDSVGVAAVDSASAPVIEFAVKTYDFGKAEDGAKINFDYEFTNTGKSPLVISNATASCGCTVPEWPKTPIKPGEKGKIKVTFDSANKVGLQDKLVTITANTFPATTQVHLVGEILAKK